MDDSAAPNRGKYRILVRISLVAGALACAPTIAHADAGIPMLLLAYPILLELLVLVVLIEAAYLRLRLRTRWWRTVRGVAIANIVTMLLGYPLMWLIYVVLELFLFSILGHFFVSGDLGKFSNTLGGRIIGVVLSAAWLGDPGRHIYWPVLLAFVILLVPSLLLSGFVEAWLLNRGDWLDSNHKVNAAVWQANLLSYVILALLGCVILFQRIRA